MSVALYGCEGWTLRKKELNQVEALEMWIWRRMLKISWRERRTNDWVRDTVGVPKEKGLLAMVKIRKVRKFEHWKRRGDSVVLAAIEGEVEGKGRRGRRRTEWVDNIKEWSDGMVHAREAAIKER